MCENGLLKGCSVAVIIFTKKDVLEGCLVAQICAETNIEAQIHFLEQEA